MSGQLELIIFLGLMLDQPDNCVALFEYAGSPPDLHWNGEYPGLRGAGAQQELCGGKGKNWGNNLYPGTKELHGAA